MQKMIRSKKGDTIIEVTIAIVVFSLIAILSMQIMDRGVAMIQGALESEMARNEIDAQAEALRYIQNSYLSEREYSAKNRIYENLWLKLSRTTESDTQSISKAGNGLANMPEDISQYFSLDCNVYYDEDNTRNRDDGDEFHNIFEDRAFVINTRNIDPNNIDGTIIQSKRADGGVNDSFINTELYPRVIFEKGDGTGDTVNDEEILAEVFPDKKDTADKDAQINPSVFNKVARVEGIWVISARANNAGNRKVVDTPDAVDTVPEFYDFHIRTCWSAPGHQRPSTIATTIRLYNPEYVEGQLKGDKNNEK